MPKEKLSEYWTRESGNLVKNKAKSLTDIGTTDRGGYFSFDEAEPLNTSARRIAAVQKEKGAPISVKSGTGVDASAKLQSLEMADDMFDAADRLGYKTADQFRTAYDKLKKASPRTLAMSTDPNFHLMTETEGASLKNVLAEKYARLVKKRDEELKSKPAGTASPLPKGGQATTDEMKKSYQSATQPMVDKMAKPGPLQPSTQSGPAVTKKIMLKVTKKAAPTKTDEESKEPQ